jgi:hypothetical protein
MKTILKILSKDDICPLKKETCLKDIMYNHKKKQRYNKYKNTGWLV